MVAVKIQFATGRHIENEEEKSISKHIIADEPIQGQGQKHTTPHEADKVATLQQETSLNGDHTQQPIPPLITYRRRRIPTQQVHHEEPAQEEIMNEQEQPLTTSNQASTSQSQQVQAQGENLTISVSTHPMQTRSKARNEKSIVLYTKTSSSHAGNTITEPKTAKQALRVPHWKQAMCEEIEALNKNKTWTLVPCPSNANVIGSKWVFKTKLKHDGSIERHKARLVAKGYSQVEGVDFEETYSPVLKPTTLRLVIALATSMGWTLRQLDIKNAFLHGTLKETVHMKQPPCFENLMCRNMNLNL